MANYADRLPQASMSAHRVLSRASAVTSTKPDTSAVKDIVLAVVSCLMSIDEELVPQESIQVGGNL